MLKSSKTLLLFILITAFIFTTKNYVFARFHVGQELGVWIFALFLLVLTLLFIVLDEKPMSYLGLNVSKLVYIPIGVLIAVAFNLLSVFVIGSFTNLSYGINFHPDFKFLLSGFLTTLLPYTIIEELLMRGYAYKKTIELTNLTITNTIFCILVVIVHWYWWDIWGQPERMFFATVTATGHLMLGYALLKSKTIYFPFALHLSGNWSMNYLISSDKPTQAFFLIDATHAISVPYQAYINFGISIFITALTMLLISKMGLQRIKK